MQSQPLNPPYQGDFEQDRVIDKCQLISIIHHKCVHRFKAYINFVRYDSKKFGVTVQKHSVLFYQRFGTTRQRVFIPAVIWSATWQ